MKKNLIPAAIAALAVCLTSVTAPLAFANEASVAENKAVDATLRAGESKAFSDEDLLEAIGYSPSGDSNPRITSINASIQGGTGPFGFKWKDGRLSVDAGSKPGVYDIAVELATSDPSEEPIDGILTIKVIGAWLSGNANVLDATEDPQNTGLKLADEGASSTVVVKDATGESIKHEIADNGTITVTPGTDAVGPLTMTVTDDFLTSPVTKTIPLRVTATVSGNYVAKADGQRYFSGVTLTQATDATKLTAVDEDGTSIEVDRTGGKIYLNTNTEIDGPITLTVTDPTLAGGSKSFTITVVGHEEDVDDNGFDGDNDGEETEDITVSGSAQELIANGESQFTGLTLVNGTEDTTVTATDKDGATLAWVVAQNGQVSVTPKVGTTSPITITVSDETLEEPITTEVTVKAPSADDSPLSSDAGNFGLVALGAVLTAVIGIIGAIIFGTIPFHF